ncbi:MAG: hypothetical protein M1831_005508 [Alyxoria varia]|nr:MAG: hypothetical protein M1831_005508 [Alyxoria varia]
MSAQTVDMTASFIPPPTASAIMGVARPDAGISRQLNDLTSVRRTEQALQRHVQIFLDAQADALLVEASDSPEFNAKNAESLRMSNAGPLDARATGKWQAQKGLPSLSEARHGIFKTMKQLARLKEEEEVYLQQQSEEVVVQTYRIEQWEEKQKGLDAEIESMEQDHDGAQVKSLMEELDTLQNEINATEATLSELRSQQRTAHLKLSRLRNSVESKSSSFKASRSMLDSEIQRFLASRPMEVFQPTEEERAYLSLPQSRRTLEMAKDYFMSVKERSSQSQEAAKLEREALRDGATRWKTAVNEVIEFEDRLKQEMKRQTSERSPGDIEENSDVWQAPKEPGFGALRRDMESISKKLESELTHAQEKGWGLLICCLGAELEAFKQGSELLQHSLPSSESEQVSLSTLSLGAEKRQHTEHGGLDTIQSRAPEVESELDPESLLMTRQDTDTD